MFNISENFISRNRPHEQLNPIGVVIHETANPEDTAMSTRNFFNSAEAEASAHVAVDWNSIVQCIPWNEVAWHGGRTANHKFIGIEMCHTSDPNKFNIVWQQTVELTAWLFVNILHINKVTDDNIMSHMEVFERWRETDHTDPIAYFNKYGKTMSEFRSDVQNHISTLPNSSSGYKSTLWKEWLIDNTPNKNLYKVNSTLLNKMAECAKAKKKKIEVISGFRTYAEQEALCDKAIAEKSSIGYHRRNDNAVLNSEGKVMVAAPGTSKHEFALALDLDGWAAERSNLPNDQLAEFGLKRLEYEDWHVQLINEDNISLDNNINTTGSAAIYIKGSPGQSNYEMYSPKEIMDIYYGNIPQLKRSLPKEYEDNIPEIATGSIYKKLGLSNARDTKNLDYFKLGDSVLQIPPEAIYVSRQTESKEYVGLRQKDSIKTKSGYRQREIRLPIYFNGSNQINGITVPGPANSKYFIDGLRPLLAQVKQMPFLPIENYELNAIHDIYAITVAGINITTVQGFPDLLQGEIIGYEFNASPFIGMPTEFLGDIIDWDLYRWGYNRHLSLNDNVTYLKSIDDFTNDKFEFWIIDEKVLEGTSKKDEDIPTIEEDNMVLIDMEDDVYITSLQVGIGNLVKHLQLSDEGSPTTQYFGSTSTIISCSLETSNSNIVNTFTQLQDTCELYARQYRNRTVQGFVKFVQPIVQLFGVQFVMVESIKIDTVPGMPGNWIINMLMTSFDKTQMTREKPKGFSPVQSNGTIDSMISIDSKYKFRPAKYDQVVEDMISQIDLYPDLELPTYKELNNAISSINTFRTNNSLSPLSYSKFDGKDDKKVDPDFYFFYPSLDELGLTGFVDENTEIKNFGATANGMINKGITGSSITRGTGNSWKGVNVTDSTTKSNPNQFKPDGKSIAIGTTKESLYKLKIESYSSATEEQIQKYVDSKIPGLEEYCANGEGPDHKGRNRRHPGSQAVSVWRNQNMGAAFLNAQKETGLNAIFIMAVAINEGAAGASDISIDKYNFFGMNAEDDAAYDKAWGYKQHGVAKAIALGANDIKKSLAYRTSDGTVWGMNNHPGGVNNYASDRDWVDTTTRIMSEFYNINNISSVSGSQAVEDKIATKTGRFSPITELAINQIHPYTSYNFQPSSSDDAAVKFHDGIDIAWPMGGKVVACMSGKVVSSENTSVTVDNEDGTTIKYSNIFDVNKVFAKDYIINAQEFIGYVGEAGVDTDAKVDHVEISMKFNKESINPLKWLNSGSKVGYSKTEAIEESPTRATNIQGIDTKPIAGIDYSKFGKPLVGNIPKSGSVDGFPNDEDGLFERMCVDMVEYNRRGTMLRAFPTYLMLFVDEGMWLDGRKLWSNFYSWHSLIDISVEKDRRKPADTALVRLLNVYNSLGVNPKVYYGEYSWFQEYVLSSIEWYTDDMLRQMISNKNRLLSGFNVKTGARIHLRMGYGNDISKLPVTFNGVITEIDTADAVTIVAQGDGNELLTTPLGTEDEDETNATFPFLGDWKLGGEPQNIITKILIARSSDFLFQLGQGKWGETSRYGIEHFGNVFLQTIQTQYEERKTYWNEVFGTGKGVGNNLPDLITNKDIKAEWGWTHGLPESWWTELLGEFTNPASYTASVGTLLEKLWNYLPGPNDTNYEDYDVIKNIYRANVEARTTGFDGKKYGWWVFDGEDNIYIYLFNKTPWDIFQILASSVPNFICQPHSHQFRSTLFYGQPHWNVRYKYEFVDDNNIKQYAKPFSQFHILGSVHDILNNTIRACQPDFSACVSTFTLGGGKETTGVMYADRDIKGEFQKTITVDTCTKWDAWGPDKVYKFFGADPGGEAARKIGTSAIQNSFREMYQGGLLVLGDAAIKPYDLIYIDDSYVGMGGAVEVGRVVHHMGLETGFVTEIKPDLITQSVESDMTIVYLLQCAASFGAAYALSKRYAKVSSKVINIAKNGLAKTKTPFKIGLQVIKDRKIVQQAITSEKGVKLIGTGRKILSAMKAARTTVVGLGVVGAPETLGASLIVAGIGFLILQLVDTMASSFINYLRNSNVIKIFPIYYKDKPFVAGINGHKNLIPGIQDEDIYPNYSTDAVHASINKNINKIAGTMSDNNKENFQKQLQSDRTEALTVDKASIERLDKFTKYIIDRFKLKTVNEYKRDLPMENTIGLSKGFGSKTEVDLYKSKMDNIKSSVFKLRGEDNPITKQELRKQEDEANGIYYATEKDRIRSTVSKTQSEGEKTFRPAKRNMYPETDTSADIVYSFKLDKEDSVFAFAGGKVLYAGVRKHKMDQGQGLTPWEMFSEACTTGLKDNFLDALNWISGNEIYNTLICIEHKNIINGKEETFLTIYNNMLLPFVTTGMNVHSGQVLGIGGMETWWGLGHNDLRFEIRGPGKQAQDAGKWITQSSTGVDVPMDLDGSAGYKMQ